MRTDFHRVVTGSAPIVSLLIEMDKRTGFLDCFTHAGGKRAHSPELKRNLIAVLISRSPRWPGTGTPGLAQLLRAGPLARPTCGREPATRHEALQQREDLAIAWLHVDGDRVTEARHCVVCQPHGPVIDVSCSCCGNGPLITGQPPELGDRLAAPALDWMHSRGWQLQPQPLCPPPITDSRQHQVT